MVNWPREVVNTEWHVSWHDGDSVDVKLQLLSIDADVLSVNTISFVNVRKVNFRNIR